MKRPTSGQSGAATQGYQLRPSAPDVPASLKSGPAQPANEGFRFVTTGCRTVLYEYSGGKPKQQLTWPQNKDPGRNFYREGDVIHCYKDVWKHVRHIFANIEGEPVPPKKVRAMDVLMALLGHLEPPEEYFVGHRIRELRPHGTEPWRGHVVLDTMIAADSTGTGKFEQLNQDSVTYLGLQTFAVGGENGASRGLNWIVTMKPYVSYLRMLGRIVESFLRLFNEVLSALVGGMAKGLATAAIKKAAGKELKRKATRLLAKLRERLRPAIPKATTEFVAAFADHALSSAGPQWRTVFKNKQASQKLWEDALTAGAIAFSASLLKSVVKYDKLVKVVGKAVASESKVRQIIAGIVKDAVKTAFGDIIDAASNAAKTVGDSGSQDQFKKEFGKNIEAKLKNFFLKDQFLNKVGGGVLNVVWS